MGEIQVVGEASNGLEAVHLFAEIGLDVVLMDLDMPVMDGVEATQIICEQNPDAKILILTGASGHDRINLALAAGVVILNLSSR